MARVGRLAGALLAESEGRFFLVGNPKEPCDFQAVGFEDPGEIDALARSFVELRPMREIALDGPKLAVELEGEYLARLLAQRLLIERNGSVSERLWRLVTGAEDDEDEAPAGLVEADWLAEVPGGIWRIVRGAVLKCT